MGTYVIYKFNICTLQIEMGAETFLSSSVIHIYINSNLSKFYTHIHISIKIKINIISTHLICVLMHILS